MITELSDSKLNFTGETSSSSANATQKWLKLSGKKKSMVIATLIAMAIFLFSVQNDEKSTNLLRKSISQQSELRLIDSCPLHIFPFGNPLSNLKHVRIENVPYFPQFAWVDISDQQVYVQCNGQISILGPDSAKYRKEHDQWIHIDRKKIKKPPHPPSNPSLRKHHLDSVHEYDYSLTAIITLIRLWIMRWLNGNIKTMEVLHLPWEVITDAFNSLDGMKGNELHNANNRSTPLVLPAYLWIICDDFQEANLILRPPLHETLVQNELIEDPPRQHLPGQDQIEIDAYMHYLSVRVSSSTPTYQQHKVNETPGKLQEIQANKLYTPETWIPKLNTVLVVYLDAVSKVKFDHFFKHSNTLLEKLSSNTNRDYSHTAIELKLLHSLGQNSHVNYPQFLSGVSKENSAAFFSKHRDEQPAGGSMVYGFDALIDNPHLLANMREPWLFDIAETLHFQTFQGESGMCSNFCTENCFDKSEHNANYYEYGGYTLQYMTETHNRFPGESLFHHSICCEAQSRKALYPYSGHRHKFSKYDSSMWVGDKLSQAYGYDWLKHWLSITKQRSRFAVMVSEETHGGYFVNQVDQELAQLIEELVSKDQVSFNMSNAGIIIMSDHGLHFGPEFDPMTGRMANKNPFGYVLLPKQYVSNHPQEYKNLLHNAQQMVTSYDLRAMTLYWMTGREWSAKALDQHMSQIEDRKDRERTRLMVERVFSTRHGTNLLTETISPLQRNCSNAGIASDFCGCHLLPCHSYVYPMIHMLHEMITHTINEQVHTQNVDVLSVCRPLQLHEVSLLVPLHASSTARAECLANDESMLLTVKIRRGPGYLVSITLGVDGLHHEPTEEIKDVFIISSYQSMWNKCSKRLEAKGLSKEIIHSVNGQFCFCLESK